MSNEYGPATKQVKNLRRNGRGLLENSAPYQSAKGADNLGNKIKGAPSKLKDKAKKMLGF